jgi:hypothetical protein
VEWGWRFLSRGSFGPVYKIALNDGQFSLVIPACESGVPLSSIPSKRRLLTAENVNCALDDIATALGQTSRVLVGVRVDLDRRSMEQRQCLTYADGSTTCGQSNSSFQPLGEGGAGGAAALANEGGITREAVNFADSHLAWRLENESSVMWECTEVDPARAQFRVSSVGGVRGSLSEDRSRRAPRPVAHSWGSGGATTLRHISSRSRLVREFA